MQNIFVIENDIAAIEMYMDTLSPHYRMFCASDVREAIRKIGIIIEKGLDIHLLLIDLMMPALGIPELQPPDNQDNIKTGYYLYRYLLKEFFSEKCPATLIITALNEPAFLAEIADEQGLSILKKTNIYDQDTILNKVQHVLEPVTVNALDTVRMAM